jgi:hypothetical protein
VKVVTDPPGADISVDEDPEEKCESPCVLTLPSSPRVIRVAMDGYTAVTRNIVPKSTGEQVNIPLVQEFGFVMLDGPAGTTPVLLNGELVARQVPWKLQLPTGKYQIRKVQAGKIVSSADVEIKALDSLSFKVPQ